MLKCANRDPVETLRIFKNHNLSPAFLVPTQTGLEKSIMDATYSIRQFLNDSKIHNYENQKKGKENKVVKQAILIAKDFITETSVSFYRPETKNGDPRIWIYGLKEKASNFDLLALLKGKNQLIIFNCSNLNIANFFQRERNLLNQLLDIENPSIVSEELLEKCRQINKKGFIKTLRVGDTGVGFTFESLLGIKSNSSKSPDYKGIEIKTGRESKTIRPNLFSMVPNWDISNLKNAEEILEKRGGYSPKFGPCKVIHHTISNKENSYGLSLVVENNVINQIYKNNGQKEYDVKWLLSDFNQRLKEKHSETFWISAKCEGARGSTEESFHYKKIVHTGNVNLTIIPTLIELGVITVDYLLWEKLKGWQKYTKKKGYDYLWKIKPKDRHLLFNFQKEYQF